MLNDPIDEAVASVPDRVAFITDDGTTTFRELADAIASACTMLADRGVGAGDRVALIAAASPGAAVAVLACARLGAAAVPMSPLLTTAEIDAIARAASCGRTVVADPDLAPAARAVFNGDPIDTSYLGRATGTAADATAAAAAGTGPRDDDVALVLLTSGTTGTPKPIPMSHALLAGRIRSFSAPPDPNGAPAVAIVCVPFHHVAGLIGVLVGLAGGNTSVLQPRFDAGRWLDLVREHRVQRAFLVPAMLSRILDNPRFAEADLTSLQMITYGAAGAPADLVARAVETMPHVAFVNVFGQTETLGAVTALGPDDHRAGRVGSVGHPMPGVDIRIVDPATGADVADGDTGEFWVRSPHTTSKDWVRSGDLVRRDADGYLYAVGRLSDVINRGGEKIDPAEVEAVLRAHPEVIDAAVFAVDDDVLGQRVAAAVASNGTPTEEEVRAWCASRLARFKVPDAIVFVAEIPLTELGKVSRKALARLVERQ